MFLGIGNESNKAGLWVMQKEHGMDLFDDADGETKPTNVLSHPGQSAPFPVSRPLGHRG